MSKSPSQSRPASLALLSLLLISVPASAGPSTTKQVPLPRPRPTATATVSPDGGAAPSSIHQASLTPPAAAIAPTIAASASDVAAVKQVLDLLHGHRYSEATDGEKSIVDPAARKLAEWLILRDDDSTADFARYSAFIGQNPNWPGLGLLRRRAEAALWQERADSVTVRAFFATMQPLSTKGRLAFARALLGDGDRTGAQPYVRAAWTDPMSRDLEAQALSQFSDLITRDDDYGRMTLRLYAGDNDGALRAAQRLGGADLAVAQARAAVNAKSANTQTQLDAVPDAARRDAGYIFSKIQWLRRNDAISEAGQLMLSAPRDPALLGDLDEWWIERRLLARKLLDIDDARDAFAIVRDAATPTKENYRVEQAFTTGWIALRFLNDPTTAAAAFARIPEVSQNPISLARSGYWMGRTFEAQNKSREARVYFEHAARYSTAYYGQMARARLGLTELSLAPPPAPASDRRSALSRSEIVQAIEILYAVNARDRVATMAADLAERSDDVSLLAMFAEIAAHHDDPRAMNQIGKTALSHGLAFDHYAFPTVGIPSYHTIGPAVEPAVVYSIVRQESAFNPMDVSSASAFGLMQVTPDAGRYVARKYKVAFDQKRLMHDVGYNLQMGAAELGGDLEDYNGSYILAFAAYNAGSHRVKEWIERYGDPRDPHVDPIDWVERIPFAETRNYVQRVLENMEVYRTRFNARSRLTIEQDLRRGTM